jgi:hypothetical protein
MFAFIQSSHDSLMLRHKEDEQVGLQQDFALHETRYFGDSSTPAGSNVPGVQVTDDRGSNIMGSTRGFSFGVHAVVDTLRFRTRG